MTHHDEEQRLKRETPSQAEGEEDNIEAQLDPNKIDLPDHDLFRETPSQAEGSREVVNEQLEEQDE